MADKRKPNLKQLPATSIDAELWQPSRLPDSLIKLLSFRDGVAFYLARMDAGAEQPAHQDRFRQIRYVVAGEFTVNNRTHGPGTMIDIPENTPFQASSAAGGEWFVLEMRGPAPDAEAPGDPREAEAALDASA